MFRRNPTRIELKLEDLNEYEVLKKELEEKNKLQQNTNKSISDSIITSTNGSKTREQSLHERIGFVRK
jgi:anaphase-promoting complex subunit 12